MTGTSDLLERLRDEGYEVSHTYIAYLIRERTVPVPPKGPGGAFLWSPVEIAALRRELTRRGCGPGHAAGCTGAI